jgi:hypothetical protein
MLPFDTDNHNEPHFHVELSNGNEVSISIAYGRILAGKIDNKTLKVIQAWTILHKDELWDRWNKAISGKKIERINGRF